MAENAEAANFLQWSSSSHHNLQNNPVLDMGPNQHQNPCVNIEDHHDQALLLRKKQQQQQQRKGKSRSGKVSQNKQKVAQRGLGVEKLERMRAEQEAGMKLSSSTNKRCQKVNTIDQDHHVVLLHPANQPQHHQFQFHPFPHLLDHHHRPHHYQNGYSSPVHHPVVAAGAAVHPHPGLNYCGSVVMNKDVADYGHQMNFVLQNFNTFGNGGGFVNGPPAAADRVLVNNPACMFSGPQEQQLQYYPNHHKELSSTQMMHCFPQQQQQQCDYPVHHDQMYPNYPYPNPVINNCADEQKPKLSDQSLELSLGRKNNGDVVNGKQGRELSVRPAAAAAHVVDEQGEEVEVVAIHRRSKALGGVRKSILMEYQFFPGKNDSNNNSSLSFGGGGGAAGDGGGSATCGGGGDGDLVDLSLKL